MEASKIMKPTERVTIQKKRWNIHVQIMGMISTRELYSGGHLGR